MRSLYPLMIVIAALMGSTSMAESLPRSVSVNGNASVVATPDRARVVMGIQARDPDLAAARAQVSRVSAAFLKLCREMGIPENKIQTSGLTLQPEYRWDPQGREQQLLGYLVRRELEVELVNLDQLGQLLENAVDSGVNQVSPPVLDSSRRAELEREALKLAALDARARAQLLAETLGARLGGVREISAVETNLPQPLVMRAQAMESADAGSSYQTGELRIESQVSAIFDLID